PANRATSSGLPLGFFGNAASTASFSSTNARATASRRVFAFALTSTMCAWPASSKCESLSGIGLQAFAVLPSMLPQQHPHVLTRRKPFPPPPPPPPPPPLPTAPHPPTCTPTCAA